MTTCPRHDLGIRSDLGEYGRAQLRMRRVGTHPTEYAGAPSPRGHPIPTGGEGEQRSNHPTGGSQSGLELSDVVERRRHHELVAQAGVDAVGGIVDRVVAVDDRQPPVEVGLGRRHPIEQCRLDLWRELVRSQ